MWAMILTAIKAVFVKKIIEPEKAVVRLPGLQRQNTGKYDSIYPFG